MTSCSTCRRPLLKINGLGVCRFAACPGHNPAAPNGAQLRRLSASLPPESDAGTDAQITLTTEGTA